MSEFDLLRKTELRIERISLRGADLNEVARVAADVLGLEGGSVLVTDLQEDVMVLDILEGTIDPYRIVGKRDRLFQALAELPGVRITPETRVCSEGMLGWIALDEGEAMEALKRSEEMAEEIRRRIEKRALVLSTGEEVASGLIRDTNQPLIAERLQAEGFAVTRGPVLKDDELLIAGYLRASLEGGGYGLILTTGGVGAEGKDRTIEALLSLDPEAATPYICKYEVGTGRHAKDGVRIAVGEVQGTLIVALPGPNDEVRTSLEVLVEGLASRLDKHALAERIAARLRGLLRDKMGHRGHHG